MSESDDSPPELVNVSPPLKSTIATEVQKQLRQELLVLKDGMGVAAKIVGGAFALLIAVFTIFGLTTWQDIKRTTGEYVQSQADKLIQSSDSETGVKQYLNDLVNRTILSSKLTALTRSRVQRQADSATTFEQDNASTLSDNEWTRLEAWLKLETLGKQEFSDTLTVLNAQDDDRKKTDANEFLAEMLNPPEGSKFSWIRKQPEKRLAILSNFFNEAMGESAVEVAKSTSTTTDIRTAAIHYADQLNYADGLDAVLGLASSGDNAEVKNAALIAAVHLRPADERTLTVIKSLFVEPVKSESLEAGALVLKALSGGWEPGSEFDARDDRTLAVSKDIIRSEIGRGSHFTFRVVRVANDPMDQLRAIRVGLRVPISNTVGRTFSLGDLTSFKNFAPYWTSVDDAANSGNRSLLGSLIIQTSIITEGNIYLATRMDLSASSKVFVRLATGQKTILGQAQVGQPVYLDGNDFRIEWRTKDGIITKGTLLGLSGGGFHLSLYYGVVPPFN